MKEKAREILRILLTVSLFGVGFYIVEGNIRYVIENSRYFSISITLGLFLLFLYFHRKQEKEAELFAEMMRINEDLEGIKESLEAFYDEYKDELAKEGELVSWIEEIKEDVDSILNALENLENKI